MWHENYKEFCSISYCATKEYKRLPKQNMWHSNNEDFLRSINNCCHNTKMWQENGKEFYSIFYSCATKEDQKKTLIFTFFMFQKLMLTVNIGCGTRIGKSFNQHFMILHDKYATLIFFTL